MSYTCKHRHAAATVDGVVFDLDAADLKLLLIPRKVNPFKGKWALPGGFVRPNEDLEKAVRCGEYQQDVAHRWRNTTASTVHATSGRRSGASISSSNYPSNSTLNPPPPC
jgi:hypothetical protein